MGLPCRLFLFKIDETGLKLDVLVMLDASCFIVEKRRRTAVLPAQQRSTSCEPCLSGLIPSSWATDFNQ